MPDKTTIFSVESRLSELKEFAAKENLKSSNLKWSPPRAGGRGVWGCPEAERARYGVKILPAPLNFR